MSRIAVRGSQRFESPSVRSDFNRTIRTARPKTSRIAVKALLLFLRKTGFKSLAIRFPRSLRPNDQKKSISLEIFNLDVSISPHKK